MFEFIPHLHEKITTRLSPILDFLYLRLKLSPNTLSAIAGVLGFISIFFVLTERLKIAIFFMIISQIFDLFDGQVATKFKLKTKRGEFIDLAMDRGIEFGLLASLIILNKAPLKLVLLVATAIALMTALYGKTRIDFGFKKVGIFLGFFIGFEIVLSFLFFLNLSSFIISLMVLDYKSLKLSYASNK